MSRNPSVILLIFLGADITSFPSQRPRDHFVCSTNWGLMLVVISCAVLLISNWCCQRLEVCVDNEGAPLLMADIFEVNICSGFWKDVNLITFIGHLTKHFMMGQRLSTLAVSQA